MTKQKCIIVSNRLPVSVSKVDGKLVFSPSNGGLATAMSSIDDSKMERLWIGWPGIASEDLTAADKAAITRKLRSQGCFPVFLSRDQVANFYEGYANDTLWPLFHYFQSFVQYNTAYWRAYDAVNILFKRAVTKHADKDSLVWVHDYHLMLLPKLVREALPEAVIGFFLHTPFPSYEIFRLLPNRQQILEGLLGADLVGFHIYDYARHFLSSVLRILGIESSHGSVIMGDRLVKVDAFPIGIDYQKFVASLKSEATVKELQMLDEHYTGQKVVISVDRLDYSKGIMKRLEAFELFLQRNPRYLKKVALVMVAVPSRTEVETYRELRDEIEQAISRINGRFATVDWTPISYQFKNLPFEQVLAMFAKADVALVTPLRDGMNLVAKEYVAAKQSRSGVLILSEMAGAIDELPEALRINPNDTLGLAEAIKTALSMPRKEQLSRLRTMQRRLAGYNVQRWAADFIEQLEASKHAQSRESSKLLTASDEQKLVKAFQRAHRRLILLDYDGTLKSFVPSFNSAQAAPGPALLELVERLAGVPDTALGIVSGRSRDTLETWFGYLPVILAAEHGAYMKNRGEWSQQPASLNEHRSDIMPILEHYTERTPGARTEQKDFALVWHYRNVPTELAYARSASLRFELSHLLGNTDIGVYSGNKVIEIKPRAVHKGAVAQDLLAMYPADFILAIGDDYTDEDMFKVLPDDTYSIKVGLGDTAARYQVASVNKVLQLLRKCIA